MQGLAIRTVPIGVLVRPLFCLEMSAPLPIVVGMPAELTTHEKRILDIAGKHFHAESQREDAVWRAFELNMTQFHQQVNALLDSEAALAYKPLVIGRLRRIRDARSRIRPRPVARFEPGWNSRTA